MFQDKASLMATKILEEKYKLMGEGKHPRLVLLDDETSELLEDSWIKSIENLPWGDSLIHELNQRKDKQQVFLGDGSIHGLWMVKVDTIKGFEVR